MWGTSGFNMQPHLKGAHFRPLYLLSLVPVLHNLTVIITSSSITPSAKRQQQGAAKRSPSQESLGPAGESRACLVNLLVTLLLTSCCGWPHHCCVGALLYLSYAPVYTPGRSHIKPYSNANGLARWQNHTVTVSFCAFIIIIVEG